MQVAEIQYILGSDIKQEQDYTLKCQYFGALAREGLRRFTGIYI